MQIIILDKNMRKISTLEGNLKDGVFNYEEGGIEIPILGWKFDTKKRMIAIDYNETIDIGDKKLAYCEFDGKDYKQLTFEREDKTLKKEDKQSMRDYVIANQLAELSEDSLLDKPKDNTLLTNILAMIALGIIVLVIYWSMTKAINLFGQKLAYVNQTVAQNGQMITFLENQNAQLYKLLNVTDNYYIGHTVVLNNPTTSIP